MEYRYTRTQRCDVHYGHRPATLLSELQIDIQNCKGLIKI